MNAPTDQHWMEICLREAGAAAADGEVPVGAVVVRAGHELGRGRNASIRLRDPTGHAEIVALRAAAAAVSNYRLTDAELIVTVEPCIMCVGAMLQARIRRVVFGCADPKAGALGSVADLRDLPPLNHRLLVGAAVCEAEARALLQAFFRQRRGVGAG